MHARSLTPDPSMPIDRLVVRSRALGELEVDGLASEALVDLRVGVEPVVDAATLLLVEHNLELLAAVLLGAETLADNLNGVDEIGEDRVVDRGEGSRARALLGLVGARPVGALGARENAARGNEEDVAVGELLLELTGETGNVSKDTLHEDGAHKPLLHLVPALEKGNRDEDDNSLPAVADLDLRILVSAKLPSAQRLFDQTVCVCVRWRRSRERIVWRNLGEVVLHLTSRAETNCSGRRALLMSEMLFWRSSRALLMAVSISEGEAREGLLGAILESCDMLAAASRCGVDCRSRRSRGSKSCGSFVDGVKRGARRDGVSTNART